MDLERRALLTMQFDLIVFDLDGTLVETREDLARSVNSALEAEGLPIHPIETIVRFVGDGALKLVQRSVGAGFPDETCHKVLAGFLEHYLGHCTDHAECYPGVREVLTMLAPARLCLLTNKPIAPTRKILDKLALCSYFEDVIGGDDDLGRKPDPAAILSLIKKSKTTPRRTLLVGDTSVDVLTARNCGCKVAGVQFGFRPEDFINYPPDYLLNSFLDLPGVL